MEGVDYSWSRPDPEGLYRAGKRFACRYLSFDRAKNLTRAEADRLNAAGLLVVYNWEATAGGVLGGWTAGLAHAREARRLITEMGTPVAPVYFSCDVNVTPTQVRGPVQDYYRACAEVLGGAMVGLYGEYDLIEAARLWPHVSWYWQTAATAWSPAGRFHPAAHITQYRNGVALAGGQVDLDRTADDDFGGWTMADVDLNLDQKIPLPAWAKNAWPDDPTVQDGTVELGTALASGWAHGRRTDDETTRIEKSVDVLRQSVSDLEAKIDALIAAHGGTAGPAQVSFTGIVTLGATADGGTP